jgi:predicted ATPase
MGIHTGTAHLNDSQQYSGYATLASTQRIMSAGHGGQILLSGATRELVRDMLPEETELLDLGERRLKDLRHPEHLYQLNEARLTSTFPPLKTLDAFLNNLPIQLTTFIGRENAIAEVKRELELHRLVTLTGSGGTGKTRLSLQVAAELLDHFEHGVWFVELAQLTDPELIPQTIISSIGIQEQGRLPLDILREYLHEKKTLIVLDNCEHLIEASANTVHALLSAAPNLRVLASSREALGVKGELSYPVPSLSLPDVKHLPVIEQLSQYEAVRLFIDRAGLVSPHFDVDKSNAPAIAQICYRLDGIPLAIELAAARVKVMSVEQISRRLDDRFRLLTGGARTSLPRQQTLRALIDWSYDLLTKDERLLLRKLSIFTGGWTLEAAEEVCSDAAYVNNEQAEATDQQSLIPDVLDLLTQLVNKSLVVVAESSQSSDTRYRMLETIRQYAREKLLEAGGGEIIRQRHLAYFVKFVEQAESELYRPDQARWSNRLEDEIDNLRGALEWAIATEIESGVRIAALPWRFWQRSGYLREIAEWLAQLLESYHAVNPLHVQALAVYAICVFRQGNFREALTAAGQSLQMARALSDKQSEAFSLSFLGILTITQGSVGEGVPLLEQSLALYRELGDKVGQANAMEWLSINSSDPEFAVDMIKGSLELNRELGDLTGVANSLIWLAQLTVWRGDFSSPAPWLEEAISISHRLGAQVIEAYALSVYGTLAYWQGEYQEACAYYKELILLNEKTGNHYTTLWARVHIAYAVLRQGNVPQARQLFNEGIQSTQKAGLMIASVFAVEGLASLNANYGGPARAAQLFAWADAMREKMGDRRPSIEQAAVERDLDVIHSQLDDSEFVRVSAEGQGLTIEEAVALALQEIHA